MVAACARSTPIRKLGQNKNKFKCLKKGICIQIVLVCGLCNFNFETNFFAVCVVLEFLISNYWEIELIKSTIV